MGISSGVPTALSRRDFHRRILTSIGLALATIDRRLAVRLVHKAVPRIASVTSRRNRRQNATADARDLAIELA